MKIIDDSLINKKINILGWQKYILWLKITKR